MKLPLAERHAIYTDKSCGATACWPWMAYVRPDGYGRIRDKGRMVLAHRVSYEVNISPIPDGLCVLHSCDNRRCQNPEHLFLGTYADNNQDAVNKGRAADQRGERNGRAKLTEEEVREIRQLSNADFAEVGQRYGVSGALIRRIQSGIAWKHLL